MELVGSERDLDDALICFKIRHNKVKGALIWDPETDFKAEFRTVITKKRKKVKRKRKIRRVATAKIVRFAAATPKSNSTSAHSSGSSPRSRARKRWKTIRCAARRKLSVRPSPRTLAARSKAKTFCASRWKANSGNKR